MSCGVRGEAEANMRLRLSFVLSSVLLLVVAGVVVPCLLRAGTTSSEYKVLAPIRQGNLTIFPVVTAHTYPTQEFLTLDEGLHSGEVVVTEAGRAAPLVRPRRSQRPYLPTHDGAQVNQLVLINNSKRPLILLAGEIVTGGKQDRVIAKDRIVPAESDPIDLGVFCVEPGRWTATKANFGGLANTMAQPGVRGRAMADKDQQKVWDEVRSSHSNMAAAVPAPAARELAGTSSYAGVMQNQEVKQKLDAVAEPLQRDYASVIKQLRDRNAVGVVVAVNDQIIWADIFASTDLLQKYWPKLVRSYAAEAIANRTKDQQPNIASAQTFLDQVQGRHEVVESEPGLYRHTEITGDGFKAFELTSLLPKTGFDLHMAKMAE
jgi:hypothetical protein